MTKICPVILSGGAGTRLWPLSRELYPKQLLPLASHRSLLQDTAGRVAGAEFAAPIVVCNEEHRFVIAEQLRQIGISPRAVMLEPAARNTAPAVAAAAAFLVREDPASLMLVLPSDHVIRDEAAFRAAVATGAAAAATGRLVTFGIKPTSPETGYGYIQRGPALPGSAGAYAVARFVEKPDLATAKAYLAEGTWLWNSGMFLFPARLFLEELTRFEPAIAAAGQGAIESARTDLDFLRLDDAAFKAAPSKSIDYAVMERTTRAAVVPADPGWSDVGAWSALWDIGSRDPAGNVVSGDVITLDTKDAYLRSVDGALLATIGLDNVVIVATRDVILAMDKARAQRGLGAHGRPSPVGQLPDGRHRRALPGEAHHRQAGREDLAAEAQQARRALGCGERHGTDHARRGFDRAAREHVRLYPARRSAPAREHRGRPPAPDRSAVRQLSRRRRHCPPRRQLRAEVAPAPSSSGG